MNIEKYNDLVLPKVAARYPALRNTRLTHVMDDVFGGALVVVRSDNQVDHEELVYVADNGEVLLFSTTEALADFLDQQSHRSLFDKLFSRKVVTVVIFIFVLIMIVDMGVNTNHFNEKVLTVLSSIATLAAGYFFGSREEVRRR